MTERLFYDGACGLCHRAVTFVLAHDRKPAFRFAPLDSDAFRAAVPASTRARLPDSLVVVSHAGDVLTKSAAVVYILKTLGGVWKPLGAMASVFPQPLSDFVYDRIAAVRYRLFAKPPDVCPVIPLRLRDRFDI